jgi:hypothetical protein
VQASTHQQLNIFSDHEHFASAYSSELLPAPRSPSLQFL